MKKTLIAIAFAVASLPMFAAHQAAGQTAGASRPRRPHRQAGCEDQKAQEDQQEDRRRRTTRTTAPVAK